MPFVVKHIAARPVSGGSGPVPKPGRQPLKLAWSEEAAEVLAVLGAHAKGVYLLGGPVICQLQKGEAPYLNFLVESDDFTRIKNELFRLGVEPVSTPDLPGTVIRFGYGKQAYSVVNMPLETYLKENVLTSNLGLIPFAHNFLVYSCKEQWVMDPFEALDSKTAFGRSYSIKVIHEPPTPLAGLEYGMAAAFDVAVLGFKESSECSALVRRSLAQTATPEQAPLVMQQVINYFPDVLEIRGLDFTRKLLVSPLCVSAARESAGIDLTRVASALQASKQRGSQITGARFMGALNREFLRKEKQIGLGMGVSDYMMAQGFLVRRLDLVGEALRPKNVLGEDAVS
jgi:hypothetical protein